MRNWINIITESSSPDISWAAEQLNDSIMHNADIDDEKVSAVLHANGYIEPHAHTQEVLRALSLPIPDEDITCGELFDRYAADLSWYRRDISAQSCATDMADIATFLASEQHILSRTLFHDADTSVRDIHDFYVIGRFSVSVDGVLWSIDGLKEFGKQHPEISNMLREALWEYGDVSELKIRASHLTPTGILPCDKAFAERYI